VVSGPNAVWDAAPDQPYVVGMKTHKRELLVTKVLDAEPSHREEIPGHTITPLLLALTTTLALWGAIFFAWWFTTGAILSAIVLLLWFWPKREDVEEHLEEEREFTMKRGGEVPA
jgi:cytochrome c oxidase subunit 1